MPHEADGHTYYQSVLPWARWRAYNPTPGQEVARPMWHSALSTWECEGARNLPQAPQFGFLSVSCGGIQSKLLATGNTDGISDLTMVNQEVIGSVGQAPIHDFLGKTATSVCANSSLFVPRHASFPSFFYLSWSRLGNDKSLALLLAPAATCSFVCCILS